MLLWDYASIVMHPKTTEEKELHRAGMQAASVWYAHRSVTVWIQPEMPKPKLAPPSRVAVISCASEIVAFPAEYGETAWTALEKAISGCAIKPRTKLLDLSKRTEQAMKASYGGMTMHSSWPPDYRIDAVCTAPRAPLPLPQVFELATVGSTGTGPNPVPSRWSSVKEEKLIVAKLYSSFFAAVAISANSFDHSDHGWGAAEAATLGRVLPHFEALTRLDLSRNRFDDAAAAAIAQGVAGAPALKHLMFNKNGGVRDRGAARLAEACLCSSSLHSFSGLQLETLRAQNRAAAELVEMKRKATPAELAALAAKGATAIQLADINLPYMGLGVPEALLMADLFESELCEPSAREERWIELQWPSGGRFAAQTAPVARPDAPTTHCLTARHHSRCHPPTTTPTRLFYAHYSHPTRTQHSPASGS